MMSLKDKIRHDVAIRMIEKNYLMFSDLDLVEKFRLVNRSPFAITLGLCGLKTLVEYQTLKLERVGRSRIIVYYSSELYPGRELLYQLPERYANVSDRDIDLINTGVKNIK